MTLITHVINTAEVGGGAEHVLALVRHAAGAGFESTVVVGRDGPARARIESAGIPVAVVGPLGVSSPLRLARVFRSVHPDILHLHGSRSGFTGAIAAAMAGVRPVVYTAHAFAFKRRLPAGLRWLAARADAFTCARVDRVICLTRGDAAAAKAAGVLHDGAVIVPNGVDAARFSGVPHVREELGLDLRAPVAGLVGRLVPDKDPLAFVAAARAAADALPEARFLIVGDGPLRGQVEEAVRREGLGARILITGMRHDVPALLATMDVLVLTSRWEGMPMVVLEAMASGRPVVAPALPGLDEVIDDGVTGCLTPPGDLAALAQILVMLLRDAPRRQAMGVRARARVHERFALERMIASTLGVYAMVRRDR